MSRYHLPSGSSQAGEFELAVTPASSGWTYASLRVLSLEAGAEVSIDTGPEEMLVVPLSGACEVSAAARTLCWKGDTASSAG